MKRLISAGILTVILVLIATVGINYVKNRVDIHLGTLNTAVEYAKSGDYTSAQKEMTILDNQFIKSKKILSLYIHDNVVEEAEKEIKYAKTLAEEQNDDFVSQSTICQYYIYQLYEVEMLGLKTWF